MNENYSHPKRPKNATTENIIKGAYKYLENKNPSLRILASGVTLNFAIDAEKELKKLGISTEIWSVTSFNELYKDGIEVERLNRYENKKSVSYVESCFSECLPTVAVSEYVRAYTNQIRQWVNGDYITLGTDGFGRSDTREELRNYFEISKDHIVVNALFVSGNKDKAEKYIKDKKIDLNSKAPWLR